MHKIKQNVQLNKSYALHEIALFFVLLLECIAGNINTLIHLASKTCEFLVFLFHLMSPVACEPAQKVGVASCHNVLHIII